MAKPVDAPEESAWASSDVMLAAVQALGHPEGNYRLFCADGQRGGRA